MGKNKGGVDKKKQNEDIKLKAVSAIYENTKGKEKKASRNREALPNNSTPTPSRKSPKPVIRNYTRKDIKDKDGMHGNHGSYSGEKHPNYSTRYHLNDGRVSRNKRDFGYQGGWGGAGYSYGYHAKWRPGDASSRFHQGGNLYDSHGYEYYGFSNFDSGKQHYKNREYNSRFRSEKIQSDDQSGKRKEIDLKRPKRSQQNIDALNKKHSQQKKLKASELLKDLEENSEIADKAAKIKEMLGSLPRNSMFSPPRDSMESQQTPSPEPDKHIVVPPRVKIDKVMVPDLVLTASDLAKVGTGKNFATLAGNDEHSESCVVSTRPSILPVFYDDQVVPPPLSGKSEAVPKPRIAYTTSVADNVFLRRKRTQSESSYITDPPAKKLSRRERINSEAATGAKSVDEAMGQIIDKRRVDKLKTSLLKMNTASFKELVDNPTSKTSRTLMKALVQENRNYISSCLNRSRFGQIQLGENETNVATVLADDDFDRLPSNVMVEISDIIKQEVPDMDLILEVKKEQDLGIDLNVKCEVQYGAEQSLDSVENVQEPLNIQDYHHEEASTSRPKPCNEIDDPTTLAPVIKKRGRPPKGKTRKIGGYEVIIGSVGDLVNIQSSDNADKSADNEYLNINLEEEEVTADQSGDEDSTNKMKSLRLIFEQESRLLSNLESVDSKMASLAEERSGLMQQLLFLSELKTQMLK